MWKNSTYTVGRPCWSEVAVYHGLVALTKLGNIEASLPNEASYSPPALIWRRALGLDVGFTSSVTLGIVPC